ncbi:MAG: creatininase family protein [Pseudomonadota bacterium]
MNDDTVVVLPLGAHEQHGPHLPFETDALIAEGICARLSGTDLHVLPVEPVGYSPEHMDFPGSRTLRVDEAVERWIRIGLDCADQGARRIVFMNAHGGNVPLVQIVCQELRARAGMLAVATKWDRFVKGAGIVSADEAALGVHGGEIETAVMLALHPDKVDMTKAADFPNLQSIFTGHLSAYGPHAFGWMAQDLNPHGVTGNAAAATAETGERLIALSVEGLNALCKEVASFDLALLRAAPDLS